MTTIDLAYPIGRWSPPGPLAPGDLPAIIDRIGMLPTHLAAALHGLDGDQRATPYRPGGWTVQQVSHHLADSHINAWIRTRLALTEDNPTILPYDQEAWAQLPDSAHVPAEESLHLLTGLHARWAALLRALEPAQWSRTYHHPENGQQRLDEVTHHYAWHGDHHLAHITRLRQRMGW